MVYEGTDPALNAIDKAISSKDLRRFDRAFEDLRNACNSCHVEARVGFIEIGSPGKARSGPSPRP